MLGLPVGKRLNLKDVIDERIHETSLQMHTGCYRSQEFFKNFGGSG